MNARNEKVDSAPLIPAKPSGTPKLDPSKYLPLLENSDISEKQKDEFLRTLWEILVAFVEMGFDVKSIPQFLPELVEDSSGQTQGALTSNYNKYASGDARSDIDDE